MLADTHTPPPHRTSDPVLAYAGQARTAAHRWRIPVAVLLGLTHVESHGDINAVSPARAFGLTQFTPPTAATYGVKPGDAASQLDGAAHYLHDLGYAQNPTLALAKYNAGPNHPDPIAAAGSYPRDVLNAARAYGHVDATATPAAPAAPADSSGGDVLAAHGSGALHALTWFGLVAAGGVLVILGLSRASGLRQPHGAIA
jgi:soluble lytic murein transglycosylase-like protein